VLWWTHWAMIMTLGETRRSGGIR